MVTKDILDYVSVSGQLPTHRFDVQLNDSLFPKCPLF